MKRAYLLSIMLLLLSSCGKSTVVSGKPGGDQTENGITAIVLNSDGNPVPGARVWIQKESWIPDSGDASYLPDTNLLETDQNGQFVISSPSAGTYLIEVRHGEWASQLFAKHSGQALHLGNTILRPTGSVTGKTSPFAWVGTPGLPHWTYADSLGNFKLDSLPEGAIQILSPNVGNFWVPVLSAKSQHIDSLHSNMQALFLLDDFEDRNTQHLWSSMSGNSWWYFAHTSLVKTTPDSVAQQPARGIDSSNTGYGLALHVQYSFDSTENNPWAEVGIGISGDSAPVNLDALQEIRFRAKGMGRVVFYLSSPDSGRIRYEIEFPTNWQEFRVPIDSMKIGKAILPDSTLKIISHASGLSWQCLENCEIWLDHVQMIGVTPRDLWGSTATTEREQ